MHLINFSEGDLAGKGHEFIEIVEPQPAHDMGLALGFVREFLPMQGFAKHPHRKAFIDERAVFYRMAHVSLHGETNGDDNERADERPKKKCGRE
ncbi:hypothetical protein DSM21852_07620 [Methylocystis bryophila]|nr:hypothetical protein DSM21852_07620 [Methylocystis bryophila]